MADVNITISLPVLIGTQKFKVRYRTLPAGAWSAYQDETNAEFTLSGLSAGSYQLEVILVLEDLTECAPTYRFFEVNDDFTCYPDFAATIEEDHNQTYYLYISWTFPSPLLIPPCGFIVEYTQGGVTTTNLYPNGLPLLGSMTVPVPANAATNVKVYADLCNGVKKLCFENDIVPINPPCTPFSNVTAVLEADPQGNPAKFYLRVTYIGSIPATTFLQVQYYQTYPLSPSMITNPDSGTLTSPVGTWPQATPPTTTDFQHGVFPTPHPTFGYECLQYKGTILDACGVVHSFCATYPTGCYSCG